jgi:iron(III) transport system substrate-binding protein
MAGGFMGGTSAEGASIRGVTTMGRAKKKWLWGVCLVALVALAIETDAAAPGQQLVFYSSVPRNLSDVLVKGFQAKNPGVAVDMFQAGTEIVLAKLDLEIRGHGRPQADVIWIQDPSAMERFAKGGFLERYVPKEADQLVGTYRDPQGLWTGTFVTHALLMYNSSAVSKENVPKSWRDLANPRFRNKIVLADPRVSGTGAAVVGALAQRHGWGFWEEVAKNKPQVAPGHPAMVSTIIAGERHLGPMLDYSIYEAVRRGQPIGFVFPEEGAIAIGAYLGIIKGTSSLDAAQKFADFFASKEAAALTRPLGMYSTRIDSAPPDGWPALNQVKPLKFSWEELGRGLNGIKKKFAEVMGL